MVLSDWRPWREVVCELKVEGDYAYSGGKLHIQQFMHEDWEEIKPAEAIKLSRMPSTTTAIVHRPSRSCTSRKVSLANQICSSCNVW